MAISDILARIDTDASTEAGEVLGAAEAEAARVVAEATAAAKRERTATVAEAEATARAAAATLLANARLSARDDLLARKRTLTEGVLERAREALESLPDAEYLDLIASGVASAVEGGETLSVSRADATRLAGLGARLREMGIDVEISARPAPLPHGVLLTGDRVRAEVSPASLVNDRRDELLLIAARTLFGTRA